MFFQNLSLQNTLKTHFSQDLRVFLVQISINNIEICSDEPLRRGVIILEGLEMTIEVALNMVSNEEIDNINNWDPNNSWDFNQVFYFSSNVEKLKQI